MYSYNPDRRGLSEVKNLALEKWQLYPRGDALEADFLKLEPPSGPRITRSTAIASIGSCFAREIKHWLQRNGYTFIETAEGPCTEAGSARYDRVYNTFSLRQEFERPSGAFRPRERVWEFRENGELRLLDPYRKNVAWETHEEMERELKEHTENVRLAFTSAEVVIMTLGLAEIWYDKEDGSVFPLVPPTAIYDPARHGVRMSTFEENLANLQRSLELYLALNPAGRVIISVSPVPLRATFRPMSSVVADTVSKSMLRAVVDEFVHRHPDVVTYFPAYEVVRVLTRTPFEDDNRHVRPETIDRIMNLFESWFTEPADVPHPGRRATTNQ